MNKTLEQLELLFENGILSKTEYKHHKHIYVLHKSVVDELEKAIDDSVLKFQERIAAEESKKVQTYVKDRMRERKIMDMYFNGMISKEDANRLLEKA